MFGLFKSKSGKNKDSGKNSSSGSSGESKVKGDKDGFQKVIEQGKKEGKEYIDHYEVGDMLGEGTFATVRLAQDVRNKNGGGIVALKILRDVLKNDGEKEKLEKEVALQKACNHKHSVALFDSNWDGNFHGGKNDGSEVSYFSLELVPGGELFDVVSQGGPFEEAVAKTYFSHLCAAVKNMHDQSISHRDLKPENLLLDVNWLLKVADYGLAEKLGSKKFQGLVGSHGYIAPEVYINNGDGYGLENDVFACGVIFFIMLTGCPPFRTAESNDWWYRLIIKKKWSDFYRAHKQNNPSMPDLSANLKKLFADLLINKPSERITLEDVAKSDYMKEGILDDGALKKKMNAIAERIGQVNIFPQSAHGAGGGDLGEQIERGEGDSLNEGTIDAPPRLAKFGVWSPPTVKPNTEKEEKKEKNDDGDDGGDDDDDDDDDDGGKLDEGGDDDEKAVEYAPKPHEKRIFTKFACTSPPDVVFGRVKTLLAGMGGMVLKKSEDVPYFMTATFQDTDFNLKALDGKVEEKDQPDHTVSFTVQIFSVKDSTDCLVLVKRSRGGMRPFMNVYAATKGKLKDVMAKS